MALTAVTHSTAVKSRAHNHPGFSWMGKHHPGSARGHATKGPSWGYPVPVLGAVCPPLSTFGKKCPRLPKNLVKLTFEYPHEEPCVVTGFRT